jgi:Bacterial TSP3 repeat
MIILTTGIVAFGIFFVTTKSQKISSKPLVSTGLQAVSIEDQNSDLIAEQDTDKDGLKDWEEVLWRTDPQKADTDGDGTSDSKEVELERNPTVKGPNDKISDHPFAQNQEGVKGEPLTTTDKFARDVFSKYITTKQANGGVPLTNSEQKEIVLGMLDESEDILPKVIYTRGDLLLAKDSSSTTIRAYGNELGRIIKTYSISARDEGIILRDSIDAEDPDILKELDPIIKSYQSLLSSFLKTRAPANTSLIHLALVNSFSDIITTTKGMRSLYEDPLAALQGAGHFPDARASMIMSLQRVKNYFKEQGVVFGEGEAGYMFSINR